MSKNGVSAKELSKIIEVSESTISGWRKKTRNPSADVIVKIANHFNVSCDWIMTGEKFNYSDDVIVISNPDEKQLISNFRKVNARGRECITENADTVATSSRYKNTNIIAIPRQDRN